MKIVLDTQTVQLIAFFERMTGARVKDCIPTDEQVLFVVEEGEIAKAIGKGGKNPRELERIAKKKVRIVDFHPDLVEFVKHLVAPAEITQAELENTTLIVQAKDLKTRGLLIGRGASHLRFFESIVKRYFPITEIKVA